MRRHKRPLGEAVACIVVVRPPTQNHRRGVHGRREEHLQVAATRTVGRDDGLHVLQIVDLGVGALARVRPYLQNQRIVGRDFSVKRAGGAFNNKCEFCETTASIGISVM